MLTSPQANGVDNFVPSHHLALITQPVLGARSRLRKKPTSVIIETSTNDKFDTMTNNRRSLYNDSPPLLLPIHRTDTSQYQTKANYNSHHESSDSGLDLSISTNSSIQLQQYPQQHISVHRPLSALNEDSTPDDGYHDGKQKSSPDPVRLRFPPVSFGRNRSMEDMLNNNSQEQSHNRSSSFTDERQQKLFVKDEYKMKRSSDGALLDLRDESGHLGDAYRRRTQIKSELICASITQQNRSLNDLTNKASNKVLTTDSETNMSTNTSNLLMAHTIVRKPNTSTLKPLRKKTKLNIIVEPSVPLTSSRLVVNDEQINTIAGNTSSSSNQTTPRSHRNQSQQQQQIKSKASTQLGHYTSQEQTRANFNRSVAEKQHQPILTNPTRRGVIQQMIPFDATPSKVNNLLLRHHTRQHQPVTVFHLDSNSQSSLTKQGKQILPTLYIDETTSNVNDDTNKQKDQNRHLKLKEKDIQNDKSYVMYQKKPPRFNVKDIQESNQNINDRKRDSSLDQIVKTQTKLYNKSRNTAEYDDYDPKKPREHNSLENYQYHHDQNNVQENYSDRNRQKQQPNTNEIIEELNDKQKTFGLKPPKYVIQSKVLKPNNDKANQVVNQQGSNHSHSIQKNGLIVGLRTRPTNVNFQKFDHSTHHNFIDQSRQLISIENAKSRENYNQSQRKPHISMLSKHVRVHPVTSTNIKNGEMRQERELSQLSNTSKVDSRAPNENSLQNKTEQTNSIQNFKLKALTSWPAASEHNHDEQLRNNIKTNTFHSKPSSSSSSSSSSSPSTSSRHEDLIKNESNTPSCTYLLGANDTKQPLDGRYVIPSNNSNVSLLAQPPSETSSCHTFPFVCPSNFEGTNDINANNSSQSNEKKKHNSIAPDIYCSSAGESSLSSLDRPLSVTSIEHYSENKQLQIPSTKLITSTDNDEVTSNYDSDDGWSDDSIELIYVDERYATEKRNLSLSSHLTSQQQRRYQVQQQNVLLE